LEGDVAKQKKTMASEIGDEFGRIAELAFELRQMRPKAAKIDRLAAYFIDMTLQVLRERADALADDKPSEADLGRKRSGSAGLH
jgi:hypothetical protein